MKRNNDQVPEFDEIIFTNRNKTYGGYDLRKRYKSNLSLSILFGIAVSVIMLIIASLKPTEIVASTGPHIVSLALSNAIIPPEQPKVETKMPASQIKAFNNLKPVVTEDTSEVSPYIPTANELQKLIENGNPEDSMVYVKPSEEIIPEDNNTPRISVEEMPEFPGGIQALLHFVGKNLEYPEDALANNIQGKVIVKFVVGKDGSVDRLEVLRGVDTALDNEALRIIRMLPKFKPGRQNGTPVPVWFTLPVVFQIRSGNN